MTKQIKHFSELPEWFKLEKYDQAITLNTVQWIEQLFIRSYLLGTHPAIVELLIELVREQPIFDVNSNERARIHFDVDALEQLKNGDPAFSFGIRHLTLEDFIRLKFNLPEEVLEAVDLFEVKEISTELLDKPCYELLGEGHEDLGLAFVKFELPDAVLIEHFKQFLAEQRSRIDSTRRSRIPPFNEWCRLGILPYLDLKIWEKENDVNIPYRVMADAIYASGEGGEETVRKTTAPLAEFLITERALEILSAQAADEIAERKTDKNFPEKNTVISNLRNKETP